MTYRYSTKRTSKTGYESKLKVYQVQRCEGCSLRSSCHKSAKNRIIQVSLNLQRHRKIAKENLESLRGIRLKKKRNWDVEPEQLAIPDSNNPIISSFSAIKLLQAILNLGNGFFANLNAQIQF